MTADPREAVRTLHGTDGAASASVAEEGSDGRTGIRSLRLAPYLFYLCGFTLWIVLSLLFSRVPGPLEVVVRLYEEVRAGEVVTNFAVTGSRFLAGVAVAVVIGTVTGVLMGMSSFVRAFLDSPVKVGLSMPAIIWAFLTVMWFGIGWRATFLTIVLAVLPFVTINVSQGIMSIPDQLRSMSSAYKVPLARRVRHLLLPAVAGYLVAGIRFGMIIGWNAALLSEWFSGQSGVGFRARYWYDANRMGGFAAWVLLFIAAIVLLDRYVLQPASRRTFAWRDG